MDLIERLVEHAVGTGFTDLPARAVAATKVVILDTLGVLVAGSSAPGCGALVDQLREWGGRKEATILVHGDRVPTPAAGLANA